ncbi:MAG: 4'-phosphopantetheinyl transferase superfamily protein [Bacteroidales bacterium]
MMTVIGNDLINLKNHDNLNTLCRHGIEKFFTQEELSFIALQNTKHGLACLWAMKESAYKCILKLGHKKAFSPAKYKIKAYQEGACIFGEVHYGDQVFFAKCIEDGDFVRSIATNHQTKLRSVKSLHIRFNHNSTNKEEQIARKIQKYNHSEPLTLNKTNNNIPFLLTARKNFRLEISISNESNLYYISVLPEWIRINSDLVNTGIYAYA